MKHSCRHVSTPGDEKIIPPNPPLLKGGRGDFQRKYIWIVLFFILIGIIAVVYALSGQPHEFSAGECGICHIDEERDPMNVKTDVTRACETCHSGIRETQSHPTDLYPTLEIPMDMPLTEGRLTCLTCHYAHPKKKKQFIKKRYFLRRLVRGPLFCSTCHEIDEKGHLVSEIVHTGSYKITNPSVRLDKITLECISCHDTYITESADNIGAGIWNHSGKLNHPIGASYVDISFRDSHGYRPADMLSKEISLFDGKIGCGTCHNIYSKLRFMLVMDNRKARLCLECHNK